MSARVLPTVKALMAYLQNFTQRKTAENAQALPLLRSLWLKKGI